METLLQRLMDSWREWPSSAVVVEGALVVEEVLEVRVPTSEGVLRCKLV